MLRKLLFVTVLTVLFTGLTAQAASKQTFDELCDEILESLQSMFPVQATQMGIHHYDLRLTDYSAGSVKSMINKIDGYEKKLHKIKIENLDDQQQVDFRLIKSNLDIALLELKEIAWYKRSPVLYVDEAINGVYSLLRSQHAPLAAKRVFIVSRMKAVPGLFAEARRNLKNVPAPYIETALELLETGSQFYQETAGTMMNESPEEADQILRISTAAREAMNDFAEYLHGLTPAPEGSFAIGKLNYDYMLSHLYFLDMDSDSLLALGNALLAEAQQAYQDQQEYVESERLVGTDSVFIPAEFSRQDIFDYYQWETNQVKLWCEMTDFVTVPENIAPVKVVETPAFLRALVPGIAYEPAGPFDSLQEGLFYVRPLPETMDRKQLEARYRYVNRRGFKGSVVHEAFPGHHLQMQIAAQNEDPVHRWQMNSMMLEGWALYCEEAVYDEGLYGREDPTHWLNVLGGIRFRAARIVSDVSLHTGRMTMQECIDWMNDVLETDSESGREYIRKEVRKQTLYPTNRITYMVGKREIMRLRDAAEAQQGPDFDLGAFHDALLAEGSIPPILLWDIMGLTPATEGE